MFTPLWFTSTFLKRIPAVAHERDSCADTMGFAGGVETSSPLKSGEVTYKYVYLDGTTTDGSVAGMCALGETKASFVDSDGADWIVPLVAAVPAFSAADVGVGTPGGGVARVDVMIVDEASDEFKLPARGSTGPTASAAFAASAALLSISSIRR